MIERLSCWLGQSQFQSQNARKQADHSVLALWQEPHDLTIETETSKSKPEQILGGQFDSLVVHGRE